MIHTKKMCSCMLLLKLRTPCNTYNGSTRELDAWGTHRGWQHQERGKDGGDCEQETG
jgi:hypothetical protein